MDLCRLLPSWGNICCRSGNISVHQYVFYVLFYNHLFNYQSENETKGVCTNLYVFLVKIYLTLVLLCSFIK